MQTTLKIPDKWEKLINEQAKEMGVSRHRALVHVVWAGLVSLGYIVSMPLPRGKYERKKE